LNGYALMVALAVCTPNPEVIKYNDVERDVFATLGDCLVAAELVAADHAYCTPKTYAPETSIRPKPRGD